MRALFVYFRRFAARASGLFAAAVFVGCQEEALRHPAGAPSKAVELDWTPVASQVVADVGASGPLEPPAPASTPSSQPASQPQAAASVTVTMAMFMKDYIEPEARVAIASKQGSAKLDAFLKQLADMAPDDERFSLPGREWAALTLDSIGAGNYADGCRQCHASYMKPYKKKYRAQTYELDLPPAATPPPSSDAQP